VKTKATQQRSTYWSAFVAFVVMALVATACGGGGAGETGDAGEDTAGGDTEQGTEGGGEASGDPIVVGAIFDETGGLNIYGEHKVKAARLSVEAINDEGGVLGRPLELVTYDTQSTNEKYTQFANQLALQDQAVVIQGGITSASREAVRPVVDRHEILYFYNEQYEGGVCDRNVFLTGVVPSQQLAALIPWAIENVGPKMYVLAADYNYGQISAQWVDRYAEENGGEVVGTDFIPLDVNEFGSTINSLQSAQPDVVVSLLVGGEHIAFYRQFAAAGLGENMRIVSPTFGLGNEQVVLGPDEAKDITVAFPYFQELDTPENTEFVERWHAEYGDDYPYIPDQAVDEWVGWHLWAQAVEEAGSLEREDVIEALEGGLSIDGPGGTVTMDGPSHHVVKDVHIGTVNDEGGFDVIESQEQVPPSFEQEQCDLIANPDLNEQFTPED
jgi:branched-chain amino acid transport system substrate-binding protein